MVPVPAVVKLCAAVRTCRPPGRRNPVPVNELAPMVAVMSTTPSNPVPAATSGAKLLFPRTGVMRFSNSSTRNETRNGFRVVDMTSLRGRVW